MAWAPTTTRARLLRRTRRAAQRLWYEVGLGFRSRTYRPYLVMSGAAVLTPIYVRLLVEVPTALPPSLQQLGRAADSMEDEGQQQMCGQACEAAPLLGHKKLQADTGKLMLAGPDAALPVLHSTPPPCPHPCSSHPTCSQHPTPMPTSALHAPCTSRPKLRAPT